MRAEQIIGALTTLQTGLFTKVSGEFIPAQPVELTKKLLHIRTLMLKLVDEVAIIEHDYRQAKAKAFDKLIKDGVKKSPAFDLLEMDQELIEKKIVTERLRNYLKYTDGLCTSIQSVLKVQSASDKNQY